VEFAMDVKHKYLYARRLKYRL